ncbi:ankyrin repeat domain-containing protein [Nocardioides sp. BP30]|uniref:ankyrin repeat domain-containing protein n=1 Tax=Nocardioides sp. BP30 TaxID=3036374 RepID=UPI0024691E17|nr:ankyrin repeat domain-containing protein [Nocardioides sp. BP30]WGL54142.1 ankyrin repeat domain-containing protein [Nocardioides sp. BP30]
MADVSPPAGPATTPSYADLLAVGEQIFGLARVGDTETLVALVDRGVPVDLRDAAGNSLLMMAAYHGHAEATAALAGRGADVDLLNDAGRSPLAGAVFKGHDQVVRVLVGHGASPYRGAPNAIATALAFGRTDLERMLRGAGATDARKKD